MLRKLEEAEFQIEMTKQKLYFKSLKIIWQTEYIYYCALNIHLKS